MKPGFLFHVSIQDMFPAVSLYTIEAFLNKCPRLSTSLLASLTSTYLPFKANELHRYATHIHVPLHPTLSPSPPIRQNTINPHPHQMQQINHHKRQHKSHYQRIHLIPKPYRISLYITHPQPLSSGFSACFKTWKII
jgi:hypothetical protein